MKIIRTPDDRFETLPGYDFAPHYHEITDASGTPIRIHYLDEGPRDGEAILCLHGQPSWSYLYRKMIPILTEAGYRVIAPDLVGFGRSDKPTQVGDYTYTGHVEWMSDWLTGLDLRDLTLVCQDWGGLVGLRVVALQPERFRRLVIANTALPSSASITDEGSKLVGEMYETVPVADAAMVSEQMNSGSPAGFLFWVKYAAEHPDFSVRAVFEMLSGIDDQGVLDGYAAPFPDEAYLAGARKFPSLVPMRPEGKPERVAGDAAWAVLEKLDIPVLTAFSDGDPVTKGGEKMFIERLRNVQNVTIEGAGHFLQEDAPASLSVAILAFMRGA